MASAIRLKTESSKLVHPIISNYTRKVFSHKKYGLIKNLLFLIRLKIYRCYVRRRKKAMKDVLQLTTYYNQCIIRKNNCKPTLS